MAADEGPVSPRGEPSVEGGQTEQPDQAQRNARYQHAAGTRLLLFQSVDLEGSTSYKQRHADGQNQQWLEEITDFLRDFTQAYRAIYNRLQRERDGQNPREMELPKCPVLDLWKVLGDELVFKAEVSRGAELAMLTRAFLKALSQYNAKIDERHGTRREQRPPEGGARLRVKGSSWTAGFPVTNAVIHTGTTYDYIGPSMDMGFRLGSLATPQRLAISVELAWLLGTFEVDLPYHFDGRTSIKGVAEGVGYPRLWIKVPSSTYYEREYVLVGGTPRTPVEIAELCHHFIREHGAPGYLPFLVNEEGKTTRPAAYEHALGLIKVKLSAIYLPDGGGGGGAPATGSEVGSGAVDETEAGDEERTERLSRLNLKFTLSPEEDGGNPAET